MVESGNPEHNHILSYFSEVVAQYGRLLTYGMLQSEFWRPMTHHNHLKQYLQLMIPISQQATQLTPLNWSIPTVYVTISAHLGSLKHSSYLF